jgi:hypothetical protein
LPSNSIYYDIAHELLNYVVTSFAAEGIDLPDRRYVHHGEPAHDYGPEVDPDCTGQLTINWEFVGSGQPGAETSDSNKQRGCVLIDFIEYAIELVRCVPTLQEDGTPPTVIALDDSALDLAVDGYVLRRSVYDAWSSGIFCQCQDIQIARMTAISPRGGVAGWRQTLQVELTCGAQGS